MISYDFQADLEEFEQSSKQARVAALEEFDSEALAAAEKAAAEIMAAEKAAAEKAATERAAAIETAIDLD